MPQKSRCWRSARAARPLSVFAGRGDPGRGFGWAARLAQVDGHVGSITIVRADSVAAAPSEPPSLAAGNEKRHFVT